MTVLLAMEAGAGPMSLSQIAACSRLQPSKVHRYLVSLSRVGLVTQSPTSGLYDLGPALRRLGAEALRRMDEVGLASEHLPGLRDRTRHSVNLAVWGDHGPVIVRWDYGAYPLPITVRVGATMPLFNSAVGQVFLAYLPETLTEPVLAAQRDLEDPKPLTAKEIERAKAIVRRDGVAFTSGGLIPGLASVAAPVFTTAASLPLVVAIALPRSPRRGPFPPSSGTPRTSPRRPAASGIAGPAIGHQPTDAVRSWRKMHAPPGNGQECGRP